MPNELHVFVVDDNDVVAASVAALMTAVGLNPVLFSSAEAFLDAYDGSQSGCLILDMRLAGMSGIELHRTLRDRGHNLPTILVTAHADPELCEQARQEGIMACMEKPFAFRELHAYVKSALSLD